MTANRKDYGPYIAAYVASGVEESPVEVFIQHFPFEADCRLASHARLAATPSASKHTEKESFAIHTQSCGIGECSQASRAVSSRELTVCCSSRSRVDSFILSPDCP